MQSNNIAKLGLTSALLTILLAAPVFANENHGKSHHRSNAGDNGKRNNVFTDTAVPLTLRYGGLIRS